MTKIFTTRPKQIFLTFLLLMALSAFAAPPKHRAEATGNAELIAVVKARDVSTAESLLTKGADPNSTDAEGMSVLHLAITNRLDRLVPILIQKGADLNYDFNGTSPLFFAEMNGLANRDDSAGNKVIAMLKKNGAKYSDYDLTFNKLVKMMKENKWLSFEDGYLKAIDADDDKQLELFTGFFYKINEPISKHKIYVLHYAAMRGSKNAIKFLVSKGANVNLKSDKGFLPISHAHGKPDVQSLLIELGSVPDPF